MIHHYSRKIPKVIAITGGKGGIGKTTISINLSIALSEQSREVLLLDADFGLANIDVLLGLPCKKNLSHVLNNEAELNEILITGPSNIKIIPASRGVKNMSTLSYSQIANIIHLISAEVQGFDYLIIDTAAGISDSVIGLLNAAEEIIVVVCNEPSSIADAYALIKRMSTDHGHRRFRILTNMVSSEEESFEVFAKLSKVTDRFLNISLSYLAAIYKDSKVITAIRQQKAVVSAYPFSKASYCFKEAAALINFWPSRVGLNGHVQFYANELGQQV